MRKNMNKITRILATSLATILCLSACGSQPTNNSSEASKPSTSTSVETSTNTTEEVVEKPYWELLDSVSDTSELPDWKGDTLDITVWFAASTTGMMGEITENDVAFKELERVTGIRFNIEESFDNGGNNVDAKLPMVVASKEFPTMIMGYGIDKQLLELYENGYLADLTKYYTDGTLDQITRWLPLEEADPYVYRNAKTTDGEYYLIPMGVAASTLTGIWENIDFESEFYDEDYYKLYAIRPRSATVRSGDEAIMVRDDILEALRPDALTMKEIEQIYVEKGTFTEDQIYSVNLNSSEEFYDFLREIKDLIKSGEYVGLDGKPMEVTYGPHTETDNWNWMFALPGLVEGTYTDYFSVINLAAESESEVASWAYSNDFHIDFMKDLNTLVREDVISQNSLLDNSALFEEKINNQHYAVTYYLNTNAKNKDIESEVGYTPIWLNVPFNDKVGCVTTLSHSNFYGIFEDSLSDEEMDQLMHAINYMNSVVGINNFYWGPETAGLFTVDADGNRSYVDEELYKCMILNEDNGKAAEYGLYNANVFNRGYSLRPDGIIQDLLKPSYLAASKADRVAGNAQYYFCPGILPGCSSTENLIPVKVAPQVYGALNSQVEGLQSFWAARSGYEDMIKKVIVAESDAEFEKRYEELATFSVENGLTEETLKQYNDLFMESNRESLATAGITFK